jgi:extracellular matrix protein 14
MRTCPLLLLLAAVASVSVSAVPSFPHPPPRPQQQPSHRPAWRSVSDAVIRTIWSPPTHSRLESIANPVAYSGHVVIRFNISSSQDATSLAEAADTLFLDLWEYTDDWVDIRLQKDLLPSLLALLPSSLHAAHSLLMDELTLIHAISDTYPSSTSSRLVQFQSSTHHTVFGPNIRPSSSDNIFFNDYQPLSVIQPWMRLMASIFTTHVRIISIGKTYEGRDIPAMRVGVHPTNNASPVRRKTILITAGTHAREWISTTSVNYIAYSLITGYAKDRIITSLLEDFDWVFVPTTNPDGYAYTWETDRLWRKNRQQTSLRFCRGLDLDRSYPFEWDGDKTRSNPCSESFAGSAPFEAVEAKRLADWARNETENNNVEFVGLLDLHSYSQQILYPYSYSCDTSPPGLENLQEVAAGLSKVMRQSGGRYYQSAPACEGNVGVATGSGERQVFPRFETGGGSFLDWVYHDLKVKYTYQIKLRDRGTYGFLLPKEHIAPTGKEVLDAVVHFGKFLSGQLDFAANEQDQSGLQQKKSAQDKPMSIVNEKVRVEDQEDADKEKEDDQDAMWELRRRRRV